MSDFPSESEEPRGRAGFPGWLLLGGSSAVLAIVAALVFGPRKLFGPRMDPAISRAPPPVAVELDVAPRAPALGEREPMRATEASITGRVVDDRGVPVAGARVDVLSEKDPFSEGCRAEVVAVNWFRGRRFTCDAGGTFTAVLPGPAHVLVALAPSEALEVLSGSPYQQEVDAPAERIDFVVRRIPTGHIDVLVVEGPGNRAVGSFSVAIHGGVEIDENGGSSYRHGYSTSRTTDGRISSEFAVVDPHGRNLHVELMRPTVDPEEPPAREVLLHVGETVEVVLAIPERGVVRGQVVDDLGAPLEDALVFFGTEEKARGDEPFEPLHLDWIREGARSGPDGWFELRGYGQKISAIHERCSFATVPFEQASRIVLPPRTSIRGRAIGADGALVAGAKLRLDDPYRGVEATTDDLGVFVFERVEAGVHAIWGTRWNDRDPLGCVRVSSDAPSEVEVVVGATKRLELDFPALSAEERDALEGVVVGSGEIFSLRVVRKGIVDGALRPGRYWLASGQGVAADFTVAEGADRATVEVGTATLVVRANRRRDVQAVPADADPFLRLAAARAYVRVGPTLDGRLRLRPGRYLLVGDSGKVLREIDVPGGGSSVAIE